MTWSLAALFSPSDPARLRAVEAARHSLGGQMMRAFAEAAARGGRDVVIYVPPDNQAFWNLHKECIAQPLSVPATIAAPMIFGLPPDKTACPMARHQGYGYDFYAPSARSAAASDAQLCESVREIAFKTVAILESPAKVRELRCR